MDPTVLNIHNVIMRDIPSSDFQRYLIKQIDWKSKGIGVFGARGVGKTTLLLHYIKDVFSDASRGLYIPADHVHIQAAGLYDLVSDYFQSGGEGVVLDEIHTYPEWTQTVKSLMDTFKKKQIIISGSSSVHLQKGGHDLSRRIVWYPLKGMSFREYLNVELNMNFSTLTLAEIIKSHQDIAADLTKKIKVLPAFADYLKVGYYPYILEGEATYQKKLLSVIEKIISEDIPAVFGVTPSKIHCLRKILAIVASSQPFTPNVEGMSRDLGISKEYVYLYLEYLEKSQLLYFLRSAAKGAKGARKPEKIYLENSNLIYLLSGFTDPQKSLGVGRETFFANQMVINHKLNSHSSADFLVDEKYVFEVGGKSKKNDQLKKSKAPAMRVLDQIEIGHNNIIPLYLFGFLY